MLGVVLYYKSVTPGNALAKYTHALQAAASSGAGSHAGIDAVGSFCADWATVAASATFQNAQQHDFNKLRQQTEQHGEST